MKIDFTVRFKKILPAFFNIDRGGRITRDDEATHSYYEIVTTNNLLGVKDIRFATDIEFVPGTVFELLALDENILDFDESLKKYFVGWYSLNEDIREFFTPTKMEKIYEYMFNCIKNHTDDKGILRMYFELV